MISNTDKIYDDMTIFLIPNVDKIYDDMTTKFMMIHLKSAMQHLSQQMRNKR